MAKNRLLITAVATVLLGFLFYNFALKPKQDELKDVENKVSEAQDKLAAAEAQLSANRTAQASFRKSFSTVVELGKAVPGDDDVRSLVVQLDSSARKAGVDFKSIAVNDQAAAGAAASTGTTAAQPLPPGATVGPAGFPIMPFSFEFTGQFFKLGDFFRRLDAYVKAENDRLGISGRLLTIDGLKLEPDTTGFPNIKATVAATSYLVSPLEGATGGATPAGPAGATTTSTSAPVDPSTGTTPTTSTGVTG